MRSSASFIARVEDFSVPVAGVGFGSSASGCRVFLVSIFPDLSFRLGGIMCVVGRQVVWEKLTASEKCGWFRKSSWTNGRRAPFVRVRGRKERGRGGKMMMMMMMMTSHYSSPLRVMSSLPEVR